jgi:integrase
MPYKDVAALMARLGREDAVAARALEVCILTAARSGEIFGARWHEFDLTQRVWTIPDTRMKAAREHRVPLSNRVVSILEALKQARTCDFVFPSPRGNRPLSHVAMAKVLTRLGIEAATVHGFRSAFRDWAGNETSFPREVAEAALAHVIGDKAEQAYRRSDALEKRSKLMTAWAKYLEPSKVGGNVTKLRARSA